MNVSRETLNNSTNNTGKLGEKIAQDFLRRNDYKILFSNYRTRFGEIDIIAKSIDGALVFIEVKTVKWNNHISPEDHFDVPKSRKMSRACLFFVNKHPEFINPRFGWRMDLIALTLNNKNCAMRYYENI